MNNELMIFENENFGKVRMVEVNGKPYAVGSDVAECLGYKRPSKAVSDHCKGILKQDTFKNDGGYPEKLIPQGDIIRLVVKCPLPEADKFENWIFDEVIPQVLNTGKFDVMENKIKQIEDETERNLTMSLYGLKQVLKVNPNDMLTVINYNQTKTELDNYKQKKQIAKQNEEINRLKNNIDDIKNDTELIKKQQVFICNRTNFNERVKILANKYFGRDIQQAYQKLFSTMRLLGSFDVSAHRKHEWEAINAERSKNGKKLYKTSTLKQKVNYLDVIDKFNKWELCSEAYKTIETEMVA